MSINVTIDGTKYSGVDQVDVGGKSLHLESDVVAPSGSVTITENGTHDVTNYAQAVVNVESEEVSDGTYKDLLVGAFNSTLSGDVILPDEVRKLPTNIFAGCKLTSIKMDGVTQIGAEAFYNNGSLVMTELPPNLEAVGTSVFAYCGKVVITKIPASVKEMSGAVFNNSGTKELTFLGTPTTLHASALGGIEVVNVPWAEGEVANAPWGAKTVNYNYSGA